MAIEYKIGLKNISAMPIIYSLFFTVVIFCNLAHATSMDELYRPILKDKDNRADFYFDLDYYKQKFNDVNIYSATQKTSVKELDYYFVAPRFGFDIKRGILPIAQIDLGGSYTIDYRYRYDYTIIDGRYAASDHNWAEDIVSFRDPFSLNCKMTIRPTQALDITGRYDFSVYRLDTQTRYSSSSNTVTREMTKTGPSHTNDAEAALTWLSDPKENRPYIKSDIDGELCPLLSKNEIKLVSKYIFEEEELGYREYKYTPGQFSQERWNRNAFYNELGLGLYETFEADINIKYYLPYTYRLKRDNPATHTFDDFTYKFHDSYDIGMDFKKRFQPNTEFALSGKYCGRTARIPINSYTENDGESVTGYPYVSCVRQDIYSFKAGETYISDARNKRPLNKESFDRLERPIMERNQFMIAIFLDYKMELYRDYMGSTTAPARFAFKEDEYTVTGSFAYGVTSNIEFSARTSYVFPHKYKYSYLRNSDNKPTNTYSDRYPERLYVDLSATCRLNENAQIEIKLGYEPETIVAYQYESPFRTIYKNYSITSGITDYNFRDFEYEHYYASIKLSKLF